MFGEYKYSLIELKLVWETHQNPNGSFYKIKRLKWVCVGHGVTIVDKIDDF
jgi:hypothetical protein